MKIFLDANVLVSVMNKEYPLFTYSSRILSLADQPHMQIATSPVCLAITFYFAEKKYKAKAKDKMKLLCEHMTICDTTSYAVKQAINNVQVKDFEDGLEYYSAKEANCHCIVTEDLDDYYFSDIEVLTSEGFFNKYMKKKG